MIWEGWFLFFLSFAGIFKFSHIIPIKIRKVPIFSWAGKVARSQNKAPGNWNDKGCKQQGKLAFQRLSKVHPGESPLCLSAGPDWMWAVLCQGPCQRMMEPGSMENPKRLVSYGGMFLHNSRSSVCKEYEVTDKHSTLGFLQHPRQNEPSLRRCPNTGCCPALTITWRYNQLYLETPPVSSRKKTLPIF